VDSPGTGEWSLDEIFSSIPDLLEDHQSCYAKSPPHLIPVETVITRQGTLERLLSHYLERLGTSFDFQKIPGFNDMYLVPQVVQNSEYIVLRRQIYSSNSIFVSSIYGQKFLPVSHMKNGKLLFPSLILLMFMGLYILGMISRYHPAYWSIFVMSDNSGEKLLVERFISICRRHLPNLLLNTLREKEIIFAFERKTDLDLTSTFSKEELDQIVMEKIEEMKDE
jgi:hypothetical protein